MKLISYLIKNKILFDFSTYNMLSYPSMKNRRDREDMPLVEACIRGDLTAWSSLTKKYSDLIRASIEVRLKKYGFTLPRQDIEDIRQNVLESIWSGNKLESVKNRKSIAYWLAIVSGNAAIEYIRKKRIDQTLEPVSLSNELDKEELIGLIPSPDLNPFDELARKEILNKIDRAFRSLTHGEKLVAKLNIYHGKKYYEIAEILNMPGGTVSSYLKRAKEKLREKLQNL